MFILTFLIVGYRFTNTPISQTGIEQREGKGLGGRHPNSKRQREKLIMGGAGKEQSLRDGRKREVGAEVGKSSLGLQGGGVSGKGSEAM